jgi:hypothetical protein
VEVERDLALVPATGIQEPVGDAVGVLVELRSGDAARAVPLGDPVGMRAGNGFPHVGKIPAGHIGQDALARRPARSTASNMTRF